MKLVTATLLAFLFLASGTAHAALNLYSETGAPITKVLKWTKQSKAPRPNASVSVSIVANADSLVGCTSPALDRSGMRGCVTERDGRDLIELVQLKNDYEARYVWWHELGHVFDHANLNDWHRSEFMRIMGLQGPWATHDYKHTPHEVFARAYAACASFGPNAPVFDDGLVYGEDFYAVKPQQHRRACKLIKDASLISAPTS